MIDKVELAEKNFVRMLPDINCKLVAISEALYNFSPGNVEGIDMEVLKGFGSFLAEIAKDIDAIDKALHYDDEAEGGKEAQDGKA